MTYRAFGYTARGPTVATALQRPLTPRRLAVEALGGNRRAYLGNDYVAGVVEINNLPGLAFVALYDQETKLLLAQMWTAADGSFRFERVALDRKCFCVAFDPITGDQAVIYDRI